MQKKSGKKPALNPEAAKILEQYRNAGKSSGTNSGGTDSVDEGGARVPSAPPPSQVLRRSGTRGK